MPSLPSDADVGRTDANWPKKQSVWPITRSLLQVYYAYMVEYRAELILWILSGSLPLILMGVWQQAADNGEFSLDSIGFTRYFLAAFLTRQFTVVWVIWDFEREMLEGQLSFRLLQPLDPGWHFFASHFAERLARLPLVLIVMGICFGLYPDALWWPNWVRLFLYLLAIAMAFSLRFVMQYTFAMLAFWTERATAIEDAWFLLYLFLSGLIAPLDVFPPAVSAIVAWTPFPYAIYFPAALLTGLDINLLQGFGALLGWFGIFWLANRGLWRLGLKQYSGMGA